MPQTVLVLVTERVEEEEELLADYGDEYWTKTAAAPEAEGKK